MKNFTVKGLDHVQVFVKDAVKSENWYRETLGFIRRYRKEWGEDFVVMGCGLSWVLLSQVEEGKGVAKQHLAFLVDRGNFALAKKELKEKGVALTEEDHTVSESLYFKDPDGHRLEITTYR